MAPILTTLKLGHFFGINNNNLARENPYNMLGTILHNKINVTATFYQGGIVVCKHNLFYMLEQ